MPVDMLSGEVLYDPEVVDYDVFVQSLRKDLQEAIKAAQASASRQLRRHADLYNRKVRGAPVEVGDRVLLANKGERGKRKLADRWESTLYVVVEKDSNIHVYKTSTGHEKTVHRNLIMQVSFLPMLDTPEQTIDEVASSDESNAPADEMDVEERTSVWVSELISDVRRWDIGSHGGRVQVK